MQFIGRTAGIMAGQEGIVCKAIRRHHTKDQTNRFDWEQVVVTGTRDFSQLLSLGMARYFPRGGPSLVRRRLVTLAWLHRACVCVRHKLGQIALEYLSCLRPWLAELIKASRWQSLEECASVWDDVPLRQIPL